MKLSSEADRSKIYGRERVRVGREVTKLDEVRNKCCKSVEWRVRWYGQMKGTVVEWMTKKILMSEVKGRRRKGKLSVRCKFRVEAFMVEKGISMGGV